MNCQEETHINHNPICFKCRGIGHTERNCYSCERCGRMGHLKLNCVEDTHITGSKICMNCDEHDHEEEDCPFYDEEVNVIQNTPQSNRLHSSSSNYNLLQSINSSPTTSSPSVLSVKRKIEQIDIPKSTWEDLTHFKYTKTSSESKDKCAICRSKFEIQECLTSMPCVHNFHTDCLKKCFEYKTECPLCKTRVELWDDF